MQKLKKYLKEGLLILIPIAIIVFVVRTIWDTFDLFGMKIMERFISIEIPYLSELVSFLVMIIFIIFLGWVISSEIGKKFIIFIEENYLNKIPFIGGTIFFTKSVVNNDAKVVIGEYPSKGKFAIGFLTKKLDENWVVIFFPTAPVFSTGNIGIIGIKEMEPLNMSGIEAMEYLISFGSSISEKAKKEIVIAKSAIKSRSKIKRRIDYGSKDNGRMA